LNDLSSIQRSFRIGKKEADSSDRTIGHNGEKILIFSFVPSRERSLCLSGSLLK